MSQTRVLVVDEDDPKAARLLNSLTAAQFPAALERVRPEGDFETRLREFPADLALVVLRQSAAGLDAVARLRKLDSELPLVVAAESPSVATAAACLRLGAAEYLDEALLEAELPSAVERLVAGRRLGAEHRLLRRQLERPYGFDEIIGTSPAMQRVFETIVQVADADVPVLVTGETGTGKELVARAIHSRSRRADRPFVPVDCGAIPENLMESEFFGHERGTFTGADSRRIGLLEFAHGGTFFLDELGELPPVLQAKLLRTLQERKIRRLGGRDEIDIDVRIVAATARDLGAMVRDGRFRQDLYYRIKVVEIVLPPIRERGDDLGLLAEYFATRASREMGRPLTGISPEAFQVLREHPWPGNARELQNVIRRAVALSTDNMLGLDDLPDDVVAAAGQWQSASGGFFELREQQVARFEREYLTALLERHRGDVKLAAQEAKLPRGTLYRLMKNHGLDGAMFRHG